MRLGEIRECVLLCCVVSNHNKSGLGEELQSLSCPGAQSERKHGSDGRDIMSDSEDPLGTITNHLPCLFH